MAVPQKFRFIDSDAHILEPNDMFEKYLDPKFHDQMPKAWSSYDGEPLSFRFELYFTRLEMTLVPGPVS